MIGLLIVRNWYRIRDRRQMSLLILTLPTTIQDEERTILNFYFHTFGGASSFKKGLKGENKNLS